MFIEPMLLHSKLKPFNSSSHYFELKCNGVRMLLHRSNGKNTMYSRHKTNFSGRIPELDDIDLDDCYLDGELVCYNEEGKEDFEATLKRCNSSQEKTITKGSLQHKLTYIVFDILQYRGNDLTRDPLVKRKMILTDILQDQPSIRKCYFLETEGILLFDKVKELDLEGIVAKSKESLYIPGIRSKDWLKIINFQIEYCYIVGYSKNKTAWLISNEDYKVVGVVEFGINPSQKTAFYSISKQLKTGENKNYIFIEPLIKCKIKHRGEQRSGALMTPIFVDFIL